MSSIRKLHTEGAMIMASEDYTAESGNKICKGQIYHLDKVVTVDPSEFLDFQNELSDFRPEPVHFYHISDPKTGQRSGGWATSRFYDEPVIDKEDADVCSI